MMRRVAIILGLAWTVLMAAFLVRDVRDCIRAGTMPTLDTLKYDLLQLLLYGTMAFLCFAVAVVAGSKETTDGKGNNLSLPGANNPADSRQE
jgi:hypothetical protein